MKWSERRILARVYGLSEDELERIEISARRLEEAYRPDGAKEYVPLTVRYALPTYPETPVTLRQFMKK